MPVYCIHGDRKLSVAVFPFGWLPAFSSADAVAKKIDNNTVCHDSDDGADAAKCFLCASFAGGGGELWR